MRTKIARSRKSTGVHGGRPGVLAIRHLTYELWKLEPQLEAAASLGEELEQLLCTASSKAAEGEDELKQPPTIHLASMSPVPAAVERLVAAGASVLGEDPTVSAWETTILYKPWPPNPMDGEAGPHAVYCEVHKQHSCLLLVAKYSPSLDMLHLLVRITLQQAKQQHRQQQQQQQDQREQTEEQPAWDQVLFDQVKGPLACRPRRAALVLQQVAELEGTAAARGLVTRLLKAYAQLSQDRSQPKETGVKALTHLAQVLLLVWVEACGAVLEQREWLVTPLQQACPLLPPQVQQAAVQQGPQLSMLFGWAGVCAAVHAAAAAAVAAAEEPAAGSNRESTTAARAVVEEHQQRHLEKFEACMQLVAQTQVAAADASVDAEQVQQDVGRAKWAAADALADLLFSVIAVQQPAVVEGAAAGLCRRLLAAWMGAQEQLRQEREDAVVDAVQRVAADAMRKDSGT